MIHPTYRYLERATRVAGLTWRQWVLLCVGGLATYLLAKALPLPAPYGLSVALTLCGTPAAVAIALAGTEAQLALTPAVLVGWQQRRAVYIPEPPTANDDVASAGPQVGRALVGAASP